MFDPELEQAVALCKSDEPIPLKKSQQYERLKLFANRQRLATESPEQAFTRFITKTPEGQVLYKTFTQTKGASFAPAPEPDADASGGPSEGYKGLQGVAEKLRAADPTMTKQQATAAALRTPEGARFALQDRKARLG